MSTDKPNRWNDEEQPSKMVTDEEGTVDQKVKNRIIQARERVDEREDDVFIGAPLDKEISVTHGQQLEMWGTAVRQYIKTIEPLLKSDEIEQSDHYYNEVEIANELVYPPDGETAVWEADKDKPQVYDIPWSLFYSNDFSVFDYVDSNLPIERGFEPPEPKRVELCGLKDVLEAGGFQFQWSVVLNPQQIGPARKIARPTESIPLKQMWLEKAVRKADGFLQQAGVGLEIGHQQTDDPDDDPF